MERRNFDRLKSRILLENINQAVSLDFCRKIRPIEFRMITKRNTEVESRASTINEHADVIDRG